MSRNWTMPNAARGATSLGAIQGTRPKREKIPGCGHTSGKLDLQVVAEIKRDLKTMTPTEAVHKWCGARGVTPNKVWGIHRETSYRNVKAAE